MKKEHIRPNDYEQRERPKTRAKQFFDIFKHRFLELIKLSLLQAVFSLPLLAVIFIFWMLLSNVSGESAAQSALAVFLITAGAMVVVLPIAFVGLTGSFYALKKLAYAEGEFAASSFFIGMKEEWKRGLLIGFIAGLSVALTIVGYFYFFVYSVELNAVVKGFGIAILAIQLIVVLIVCYYSMAQVVVYSSSFRQLFKNSIIMGLIRFPINLGLVILYPGGFIALCCIIPYTMFAGIGLMILTSVFGHLLWMMNCMSAFDKYINKEHFPDYYRKGLYQETKEE